MRYIILILLMNGCMATILEPEKDITNIHEDMIKEDIDNCVAEGYDEVECREIYRDVDR